MQVDWTVQMTLNVLAGHRSQIENNSSIVDYFSEWIFHILSQKIKIQYRLYFSFFNHSQNKHF